MESEKLNRLPEGVGKRIIETLKNQEYQAEYDEQNESQAAISEEEVIQSADYNIEEGEQQNLQEEITGQTNKTDSLPELYSEPVEEESEMDYSHSTEEEKQNKEGIYSENYNEDQNEEQKKKQTSGISDVDTLLNLISQLPSGVTKQTGAIIIRQTMEAMGISMNKVLGDAQSVQEGLEHSIRNNVNVIEEYRTKIKILEQEIHKFRKKAHELEDIISLFILSEEKK